MRSHKAHRLRSAGLCFHAKLSAALALHALYALRSTIPVPQPCEAPGRARRLVDEDSWALGSDLKDLHVFSGQALSWDPCSQSRVPFSHVLRAGARPESMKRLPSFRRLAQNLAPRDVLRAFLNREGTHGWTCQVPIARSLFPLLRFTRLHPHPSCGSLSAFLCKRLIRPYGPNSPSARHSTFSEAKLPRVGALERLDSTLALRVRP